MSDPMREDATLVNVCTNCGYENRPGALICTNCNAMLVQGAGASTKRLASNEYQQIEENPEIANQDLIFAEDASIALVLKEVSAPIVFEIGDQLVLGRYDKTSGTSPDIDFHRFAGYLLGVSRRHAIFHRRADRLYLEDLGSSNGTYINGKKLKPNQPHVVPNQARVRLGDLSFLLRFQ